MYLPFYFQSLPVAKALLRYGQADAGQSKWPNQEVSRCFLSTSVTHRAWWHRYSSMSQEKAELSIHSFSLQQEHRWDRYSVVPALTNQFLSPVFIIGTSTQVPYMLPCHKINYTDTYIHIFSLSLSLYVYKDLSLSLTGSLYLWGVG